MEFFSELHFRNPYIHLFYNSFEMSKTGERGSSPWAAYFPGFVPVKGSFVGQAYKKAILGVETGKIFKVY